MASISESGSTRFAPRCASSLAASLASRTIAASSTIVTTPFSITMLPSIMEVRTSLVYRLRVQVDDPDNVMRQGMPVTVTLVEP